MRSSARLTLTFLETVMDGVMVLVTLAVMLWYSPTLTLIVVVAAACYGLLRWTMYGPQRRATDERIVHEAKAATHFIETLRGMMAIKLNLRESERRSAYLNHVVDQTNADVRVQNLALLQRAGNVLIFGLENVLVIWLGAYAVLDRPVLGRHAVRVPAVQAAVHHAREQPCRQEASSSACSTCTPIASPTSPWRSPKARPSCPQWRAPMRRSAPFALEARDLGFAYGIEGFVFRGVDFSAQARRNGRDRRASAAAERPHWSRCWPACSTGPRVS